jgi:hypothetical protein
MEVTALLVLISGFPKNERQRVLWNSTVRLSQEYFDSLQKHAVPLHESDLAALAQTSMGLANQARQSYSWGHQWPLSSPEPKGQCELVASNTI